MPQATAADPAIAAVRQVMYDYVEKGTFRQLKEASLSDAASEFRFAWLSEHDRMAFVVDRERGVLEFRGFLAKMPERVRSFVDAFVADRGPDGEAPPHRRVDPDLGELFLESAEDGRTSVGLDLRSDGYAEGARKLINLMNELVFSLQMRHADYTYTHFSSIDE